MTIVHIEMLNGSGIVLDRVGDELQRISVMNNLPSLIGEDLTGCIQKVIPRMQQTLPHGSTEYNMSACNALRTVATQNLMSADNFTKVFLQSILNSLGNKDSGAADEWLNTLLDIIPVLPTNILQNEILPIAVSKAHISKPVAQRINSCKILGRLALTFPPVLVKNEIVPVVISLCQDVSGEVRAVMTTELPNVAATLGQETSAYLMTYILDLNLDEDMMVREAILEAIAQMLPQFSPDILKTAIIPYTKRVFPEIMKTEKQLILPLSKFYGQYAIGLKNVMTMSEKNQFLLRYIQMSQLNVNNRKKVDVYKPMIMDEDELALRLTECRLNCAYNFPAMVVFATEVKQDTADTLLSVLHSLASDNFYKVRRKIAAGFFEVMKVMPKWHSEMKAEFIHLLKDEMDAVLESLVPNVSAILLKLSASGCLSADKPDAGKDVGQALLTCEMNLSDTPQWRLHEEMLKALKVVPKVFHADYVSQYFVPLLLSRAMNGRILPCRVAAINCLLFIIVDPSQAKHKLKMRNKLIDFCNSSTFQHRLLFLKGMSSLINISPDTLRELFFMNIISLKDDKVANIRLVLCKILPKMKAAAMEPLLPSLVAAVDATITTLRADKDRDVCEHLKNALIQIDELDKPKGARFASDYGFDSYLPSNSPKGPSRLNPLTDMRSNSPDTGTRNISPYAAVQSQRNLANQRMPQGARRGVPSVTPVSSQREVTRIQTRSAVPRTIQPRDTNRKRPPDKLLADDFIVDAGVRLKTTVEVKYVPTPRPVHRTLTPSPEAEKRLDNLRRYQLPSLPVSIWGSENKNLDVLNQSLPGKTTYSSPRLSIEEIEKELMLSEPVSNLKYRSSDRLKYAPAKNEKKEKKRYSLDVSEMSDCPTRPATRPSNANKRYSLNVDSKKDSINKKSLTCINNNTLTSPKIGSTRSGLVRPQSCILESEKVNHSKRSSSVENLPPKLTRLASRLPIRSADPKLSKQK